ncbi:murein L,D-transpeptidase family protein [Azotobacter chroococcum]|jgi:murein L,D-transpeptidase YafK|uniref:L,D-transpeptidase-like protein n=1 Tax=Azotobacter chroococcum TaxID=353 RepID=A0A4R1PSB1_9GAMM|nr:L,D-transpeptidase family protein [Azotobacter chroococcum]TBV98775.1 hypothetical protein E0E53_07165 [Azotobacter chroococcum]TCL34592.1 L,D-transpeptidase-like protein [Azotobacter chroococcum]
MLSASTCTWKRRHGMFRAPLQVGLSGAHAGAWAPSKSYRIDYRKADSGYYRALHISYPNAADTEAARKKGLSAGGATMIHGQRNGFGWIGKLHRLADWTLGCIAVTDRDMAELWRAVPDGTPIELKP